MQGEASKHRGEFESKNATQVRRTKNVIFFYREINNLALA